MITLRGLVVGRLDKDQVKSMQCHSAGSGVKFLPKQCHGQRETAKGHSSNAVFHFRVSDNILIQGHFRMGEAIRIRVDHCQTGLQDRRNDACTWLTCHVKR